MRKIPLIHNKRAQEGSLFFGLNSNCPVDNPTFPHKVRSLTVPPPSGRIHIGHSVQRNRQAELCTLARRFWLTYCHAPSSGGGVPTLRNAAEPVKGAGGSPAMLIRIASADHGRVLAIVPAPQFSGQAVIDVRGLAPRSFATWDLRWTGGREQLIRSFRRHLFRALRLHLPGLLVLGVAKRDSDVSAALRETAKQLAASRGMQVAVLPVAEARQMLIGGQRGENDGALADKLAEGFFPELLGLRAKKQTRARKYRLHAYEAAALGVLALVERAPLSAAVIAKDAAFAMGNFNAALTASAKRLLPQNL